MLLQRCFALLTLMLVTIGTSLPTTADDDADDEGWIQLWDGESMEGWRASENSDSWSIDEGVLVCHGPRSHLFYVGEEQPFDDFEFQCEVMTTPGSNAGIYFHTRYQEEGWPRFGYECQVNVTHRDNKKSGSIYGVVDVLDPDIKDNEWYTQTIIVRGRRVISKINDEIVVDFTEPEDQPSFSDQFERRLGEGTFAFQAHDPDSRVYFRNIRVRRLDEE